MRVFISPFRSSQGPREEAAALVDEGQRRCPSLQEMSHRIRRSASPPRSVCLFLTLSMALSSCAADKKAATKSNFRAAAQQALVKHPQCLPLSFPVIASQAFSPHESIGQQIQVLISAGLVAGPHPVPVEKGTKASIWTRPSVEYDLTPLGQKYKAVITPFLFKPQTELCYTHAEITAVDSFTEPAPFLGQIMTTVTYEYRLVDFAPWALQPAIVQAFHLEHNLELKNRTEKGKIALSQTSEGWREVQ